VLGTVLALTAALCWGTAAIFARLGLQGIKTLTGTLISMVSSAVLLALVALLVNFDDISSLLPTALLWFGLIGFINFFIGRQCNYSSIRYIGVTRATPIFASAPLFSMVLAVACIGESINPTIVIGTLSILVGIYLVVTGE
jgi:drug/metabolite transporter (DMT)-like permease